MRLSTFGLLVALAAPLCAQHPGAVVPLTPPGSDIDNVKGNWVLFETAPIAPITLDTVFGQYLFVPNNPAMRISMVHLPTNTVVGEIPSGPGIVSMVPRPGTYELWCVDSATHAISVVDVVRQVIMRTIQVGKEPHGIAFMDDGSRAWVTCSADSSVDVIDCATYTVASTIKIPSITPRGIVVAGEYVWVAAFHSGNNTTSMNTLPPNPLTDRSTQVILEITPSTGLNPLPDGDLFAIKIDPATPSGDRLDPAMTVTGVGTTLLNLHVRPGTKELWIPNTNARNAEFRGEANFVGGQVVFNRISVYDTGTGGLSFIDLDTPAGVAGIGCAQPSSISFDSTGARAYVAAYGSDTIAVLNAAAQTWLGYYRVQPRTPALPASGSIPASPARCGPRGLILSANDDDLYVFNKADNSYSAIHVPTTSLTGGSAPIANSIGYDPTPDWLRRGRGHLINADHSLSKTSSCASCHVDGHLDFLMWDLSDFLDPAGTPSASLQFEKDNKGPMATQSLRGLFESAPYHWRGERKTLEDFNPAFVGLLKRPAPLSAVEFGEFKAFLDCLTYPSNPRQEVARTYTGNAAAGLNLFKTVPFDGQSCSACHSLPLGTSAQIQVEPVGPPALSIEVTQLRGVQDKLAPPFNVGGAVGWRTELGSGLLHSGFHPSLMSFVSDPVFATSPTDRVQLSAYLSAFDTGLAPTAGGWQRTFHTGNTGSFATDYNFIVGQAILGNCDVVAYSTQPLPGGAYLPLTATYDRTQNLFQLEYVGAAVGLTTMQALVSAGLEVTLVGVPLGMGWRIGVDRDYDGLLNNDEYVLGTSPFDPDFDGDGFPDGYEAALIPLGADPTVFSTTVPDSTPPAVIGGTGGINLVWINLNALKLEFATSEPCRATLAFSGVPIDWASPSPRFPGFDVNHSIVIPFLPQLPFGSPFTGVVDVLLTDPAGNPSSTPVTITLLTRGDVIRVKSITSGILAGGVLPVTVRVEHMLATPGLLPGYGVEAFAWYEATGVPLQVVPIPASVATDANGDAFFNLTIPTTGSTGRKLHFGVRQVAGLPGGLFYVEAEDLVNFTTFNL